MSGECDRCGEHCLDCHCEKTCQDEYKDLDELIGVIENIKEKGNGPLSYPKALYLLAKELRALKNE